MKKLLLLALLLIPVHAGALGYYSDVLQDEQGNTLAALTVTVYLADTVTPATLYSDNGITAEANPMTTDYLGRFEFWAANGLYDVCVSGSGITPWCLENVRIEDSGSLAVPAYNVTDARFGAVAGDDIDDSAAFQACLDAIEATGEPGTMIVPPGGEFNINSYITLPSSVTITGGGKLVAAATTPNAVFYADRESDITISGIEIDGNSSLAEYTGAGTYSSIRLFACSNVHIKDCTIYDSEGDCIYISRNGTAERGSNIAVTGNRLSRARRDGIAVIDGINVVIQGNTILDTYGQAVDIEPNSVATYSQGVDGLVISDNVCYCALPMTAQGAYSWMPTGLGCDFKAGGAGEEDTHGYGIVISGNVFRFDDPDPAGNDDGTRRPAVVVVSCASDSIADVVFSGNVVRSNAVSGYASYGLLTFRDNLALTAIGNTITGSDEYQDTHSTEPGDWGAYAGIEVNGPTGKMPFPVVLNNRVEGNFRHCYYIADVSGGKFSGSARHTGADQNTAALYCLTSTACTFNVSLLGGADYSVRMQDCTEMKFEPGCVLGAADRAIAFTGTASVGVYFLGVTTNQVAGVVGDWTTWQVDRTGTVTSFNEAYTIYAATLP